MTNTGEHESLEGVAGSAIAARKFTTELKGATAKARAVQAAAAAVKLQVDAAAAAQAAQDVSAAQAMAEAVISQATLPLLVINGRMLTYCLCFNQAPDSLNGWLSQTSD